MVPMHIMYWTICLAHALNFITNNGPTGNTYIPRLTQSSHDSCCRSNTSLPTPPPPPGPRESNGQFSQPPHPQIGGSFRTNRGNKSGDHSQQVFSTVVGITASDGQPCPFFAAKPAATTLTNIGLVTSATSANFTTAATSSCNVSAAATGAPAATSATAGGGKLLAHPVATT